MRLGIAGEEHHVTSTDFLELEEFPRRIVFVGGSYIAAEFSHVAIRAGAEVRMLEQSDRVLRQFDPDLVALLQEKSANLGKPRNRSSAQDQSPCSREDRTRIPGIRRFQWIGIGL